MLQTTPANKIMAWVTTVLTALVPSFFWTQPKQQHNRSVGAFDGLRGIMSLIVFHEHLTFSFEDCWYLDPAEVLNSRIMHKPFLNLLFSGISAVDIFFFMSGYVLVQRPLKLIRNGDISGAFSNVSSAVFRRGIRLYLPCFAVITVAGVLAHLGAFDAGAAVVANRLETPYRPTEASPPVFDSVGAQIWDVLEDWFQLADQTIPWRGEYAPDDKSTASSAYDLHLWTIPMEFKCSMLIFMILIATAPLRAVWRFAIHLTFWLECMNTERWSEAAFIAGLICAEVDVVRKERRPNPIDEKTTPLRTESWSKSLMSTGLTIFGFIFGLYLMSIPRNLAGQAPWYIWLMENLAPTHMKGNRAPERFIRAIGVVIVTWISANSTIVAPIYTNAIAQYLGKISFAMYLVHGTILKAIGYAMFPTISDLMVGPLPEGEKNYTSEQYAKVWLCSYFFLLPIIIWAADLFTRVVDLPSMKFARWVERKMKAPLVKTVVLSTQNTSCDAV